MKFPVANVVMMLQWEENWEKNNRSGVRIEREMMWIRIREIMGNIS